VAHESGVQDGATARQNIVDTAAGQEASRSDYGTAPGGAVWLDSRMLSGMLRLANSYRFRVTEIAGGSHSENSRHYAGVAFDVGTINGIAVNRNNRFYRQFMADCRRMGATQVLGPGYPGHETHIHVAWPRP
jgi:zinc D-Ala-D-Ala carboxypeptidase